MLWITSVAVSGNLSPRSENLWRFNFSPGVFFVLLTLLVSCTPDSSLTQISPGEIGADPQRPLFVTAHPDAENVQMELVAEGLERPLFVTHAGDGSGRLFVIEQAGFIRIILDGELLEHPFLAVNHLANWFLSFNQESNISESGLLGMAFHPNYPENGIFYISYTDLRGDSVLARYQVSETDPNRADLQSGQVILTVDQPDYHNNGGMVAFGPDDYLYIALGDGGGGHFSLYSQLLYSRLGSILRIDVADKVRNGYRIPSDNPFVGEEEARPEIWVYGLRYPWRFSFDRATGDLWIGDVGETEWEELNYQSASSDGGENYGWPFLDAIYRKPGSDSLEESVTPAFFYSHEYGMSITAGYVYRGEAIADLYGVFLFGDFGSGRIWSIYRGEDGGWQVNEYMDTEYHISSFGEDEEGELYIVDYFSGRILKFVPQE